jgi:malate dehydrogenase (oxaloacetate-decarboxylating)
MNDTYNRSLELHEKLKGKIALSSKKTIKTRDDLSLLYTPGVAAACKEIDKNKDDVWRYTSRGNWVAIVSDGSAVLGLGNIGPEASLPVMEGKAVLFKEFADVDAFPICLATQDVDEIVETVKRLAPSFGGINLEDISAPRCFEIEERLKAELDIPIFHDDQHGTAIVVLAGLINAAKVIGSELKDLSYVISGAGAAGVAITKLLLHQGVKDIIVADSKGIISKKRADLNIAKQELSRITNSEQMNGTLEDAVKNRDVFIGVSAPNIMNTKMVQSMNKDSIIFALSNPTPEIMPDVAKKAGARIVATGRSDFPNQVNNVLAFPGIFKGVFEARGKKITPAMKLAAAQALSNYVTHPSEEQIIPDVLDKAVTITVAKAVKEKA